jgi:anti-anti-sigma factor
MTQTTLTRQDEAVVVRPGGDVVAAVIPELRETLRGAVAEGARDMVLDLANVQMLDSSGIGLLIAAHNSIRKLGGRLSVIHASREIVDLLHTMRIHRHISVAEA